MRYRLAGFVTAALLVVVSLTPVTRSDAAPGRCARIPPVVASNDVPRDVKVWAGGGAVVGGGELWTQRRNIDVRGWTWTKDSDGSYSLKFPWYLIPAKGDVPAITGRRLDGPGTFDAKANAAYGPGVWAVSGLHFSSAGCWEVTGSYGDSAVTFRMRVG